MATLLAGGYLLLAYILAPLGWLGYAHLHPALDATPRITLTADDHPGDPINVALVGEEDELRRALLAAGWFPADPITLRSSLHIAEATVLRRPYNDAPVSSLYLGGRKQDLAFEKPVGRDPRQRHHVRFWRRTQAAGVAPLWAGAATFDERVGLSRTTGQVTHHIRGDIDAERDALFADLQRANRLAAVERVPDFHTTRTGRNGGGDRWRTDGELLVGELARSPP